MLYSVYSMYHCIMYDRKVDRKICYEFYGVSIHVIQCITVWQESGQKSCDEFYCMSIHTNKLKYTFTKCLTGKWTGTYSMSSAACVCMSLCTCDRTMDRKICYEFYCMSTAIKWTGKYAMSSTAWVWEENGQENLRWVLLH